MSCPPAGESELCSRQNAIGELVRRFIRPSFIIDDGCRPFPARPSTAYCTAPVLETGFLFRCLFLFRGWATCVLLSLMLSGSNRHGLLP
ncbi:hypothetical protein LZ31DRAFT_96777 [Colletotrichum somersetense]|nr:hypothetical protein LZ31DRAFT_96777 [Colletotrichum somersetense]